ncbi:MAG: hypothetical protein ABL907_11180 [Hyphomicrobium sp.]
MALTLVIAGSVAACTTTVELLRCDVRWKRSERRRAGIHWPTKSSFDNSLPKLINEQHGGSAFLCAFFMFVMTYRSV